MKTILCFGDSNTWGTDPETGARFSRDVRWPGVLRRELGDGFEVIEEAKGGRTTGYDHPLTGSANNGMAYLYPCLESHQPLDLVIIMLGTNDLQGRIGATASEIGLGVSQLARLARQYAPVLIVAPPPLEEMPPLVADQYRRGHERSRQLPEALQRVAELTGSAFLDAGAVARFSPVDGLHLDRDGHHRLASAIAPMVRRLLASRPTDLHDTP